MLQTIRKLWRYRSVQITLEILFFMLLYLAARAYMQRDLAAGPAPQFSATTLSGEYFDMAQPRTHPVLLHFWATWCGICRLEQDSIESISKDHQVITVAMNSGDEVEVQQFMQQEGLTFPVVNDPQGELALLYGVRGVPTSFVINSTGRISAVERGYTTEWGLRLRLWWSN